MILSLDLGLKTGVHLSDNNHAITIENRPKGCTTSVYYNLYNYLEEVLQTNCIEAIAYEEAKFQQGMAIAYYHGFAAVVQIIGDLYEVPVIPIPVGTIKKSVTGKGLWGEKDLQKMCQEDGIKLTNKAPIMRKCRELGYTFDDENSADAIAVTLTYNELYYPKNETIH